MIYAIDRGHSLYVNRCEFRFGTIDLNSQAAAIDCGDFQSAERWIAIALSGNPPAEIAAELKDLFVQINLPQYCERQGFHLNLQELTLSKIA